MTLLTRTDADHIAHLEMTSPGNLNALSNAMIAALLAELDTIAKNDTIRVVILSGAGKAFCAGHDLKEMQADRSPEALKDLFNRCTSLMERIQTLPQPVIAQVHGIATAAGCQKYLGTLRRMTPHFTVPINLIQGSPPSTVLAL